MYLHVLMCSSIMKPVFFFPASLKDRTSLAQQLRMRVTRTLSHLPSLSSPSSDGPLGQAAVIGSLIGDKSDANRHHGKKRQSDRRSDRWSERQNDGQSNRLLG